jgi:hypothetical protein
MHRRKFLTAACGGLLEAPLTWAAQSVTPARFALTSDGEWYARELSLARMAANRRIAAWVEARRSAERICIRAVDSAGPRETVAIPPGAGAASTPRIAGPLLIWSECKQGAATLFTAPLDADKVALGRPEPLGITRGWNCGDYAVAQDDRAAVWLLTEVWGQKDVLLRLLQFEGGRWRDLGALGGAEGMRFRPVLHTSGGVVSAAWDEYVGAAYRVVTARSDQRWQVRELPTSPGCWESLAAVTRDAGGTCFAARCRERLVELRQETAGYHTELVVARQDGIEWRDVAAVDIDFALNPWMAAYVGMRRYPVLIPRESGAWLLWEEKQDVEAMRPNLGRLCAQAVGDSGLSGPARVAVDGRCMFVVESGTAEDDVWVASKTQFRFPEQRIPYELLVCDFRKLAENRPAGLASNRHCPAFPLPETDVRTTGIGPEGRQLYFGDLHLHSRLSQDLEGEQDVLYQFARRRARLDFVAFTENDFMWFVEPMPAASFERSRRNARFFNEPGKFTALLGWEFTKHRRLGDSDPLDSHRSVLYPGDEGAVYGHFESDTPTPKALTRKLEGQRVVLQHHHSYGLDLSDADLERTIELCSGWGNNMERPGFVKRLHELLNSGHRLGFVGASDNHERNPGLGGGLTGVWARHNTREEIFGALRQRRVFATTGVRADVRFWVGQAFLGGETKAAGAPDIRVEVRSPIPAKLVEIVRDGAMVHSAPCSGREVRIRWTDSACPAGSHWYYAHVLFEGEKLKQVWNVAPAYGLHAWASPVWLTLKG